MITTLTEFYNWRIRCPICSIELKEKLYIDPNFTDKDINLIKLLISGAVGDNLNKIGLAIQKIALAYDYILLPKFADLMLKCDKHYNNIISFLGAGLYDLMIVEEILGEGITIENILSADKTIIYTNDGPCTVPLLEKSLFDNSDWIDGIQLFI